MKGFVINFGRQFMSRRHVIGRVTFSTLTLLAILLSGTSCFWLVVGGAGAGTYRYIKGDLTRNYAVDLDRAFDASRQAMKSLSISLTDQQKDSLGAVLKGERSDGSSVKIVLEPAAGNSTTITVRVGVMGNRRMAGEVHEKIQASLPG